MQNIFSQCCAGHPSHICRDNNCCKKLPEQPQILIEQAVPILNNGQPEAGVKLTKPDLLPLRTPLRSPRSRKANRLSDIPKQVDEDLEESKALTQFLQVEDFRGSTSPRKEFFDQDSILFNEHQQQISTIDIDDFSGNQLWNEELEVRLQEEDLSLNMHNYSVLVNPGSIHNELPVVVVVNEPYHTMSSYSDSNYYNFLPQSYVAYQQPDFGDLSVQQLRDLAARQQQQINHQNETLAQKQKQLNYLQYWRDYKQRLSIEYGKILHLRAKIESQEMMLYDYRRFPTNDFSSSVFATNENSVLQFSSIRDELQWIQQHLNDKEDELSKAMNQVEDLTYHLKNVRNFRSMCDLTSRCDTLRRQFTFWFHFNARQSEKITEQQNLLTTRMKEMESLNERIMEMQEKLVKHQVEQNLQYRSTKSPSAESCRPSPVKGLSLYSDQIRLKEDTKLEPKEEPKLELQESKEETKLELIESKKETKLQLIESKEESKSDIKEVSKLGLKDETKKIELNGENDTDCKEETKIVQREEQREEQNLKSSELETESKSEHKPGAKSETIIEPQEKSSGETKLDLKSESEPEPESKHETGLSMTDSGSKSESEEQTELPILVKTNEHLEKQITPNEITPTNSQPEKSERVTPESPIRKLFEKCKETLSPIPEDKCPPESGLKALEQTKCENVLQGSVNNISEIINPTKDEIKNEVEQQSSKLPKSPKRTRDKIEALPISPKLMRETCKEILSAIRETKNHDKTQKEITNEKSTDVIQNGANEPAKPMKDVSVTDQISVCVSNEPLDSNKIDQSEKERVKTNAQIHNDSSKNLEKVMSENNNGNGKSLENLNLMNEDKNKNESASKMNALDFDELISSQPYTKRIDPVIPLGIDDQNESLESITCIPETPTLSPIVCIRRTLRLRDEKRDKNDKRVSFDPLALLLDASLEGELEIVEKCVEELTDASRSNDDGITALHNAICAEHFHIVRYLVEQAGADVNAQDSDGWTPLHCAASAENVEIAKYLVEHGACIFAATRSDAEIPAEKCEYKPDYDDDEDELESEFYDRSDESAETEKAKICANFLKEATHNLGIANAGEVFALYDYSKNRDDELSFSSGDKLTILRRGDDVESEWWWAKKASGAKEIEGYVPRNLLGVRPRLQDSVLNSK